MLSPPVQSTWVQSLLLELVRRWLRKPHVNHREIWRTSKETITPWEKMQEIPNPKPMKSLALNNCIRWKWKYYLILKRDIWIQHGTNNVKLNNPQAKWKKKFSEGGYLISWQSNINMYIYMYICNKKCHYLSLQQFYVD